MQHDLVLDIAEIDLVHRDFALERGISHAAGAVGMLPSPHTGMLVGLLDLAVRTGLCVYKGNVAVVHLGLLVDEREYALCARESHYDEIELLNDLVYRHCEAA